MIAPPPDLARYSTECYISKCGGSAGAGCASSRQGHFVRFAVREQIADEELCVAVRRAGEGLIDADLGGGVIKQRLAREGQGKSGGFRSIVLFRRGETAFFVYGFAKNDRDNIRRDELKAFRKLADEMLSLDAKSLTAVIANGTVVEIDCNG